MKGKRIIITAPQNYACRLADQIARRGGIPLLMPTIETCFLENYTALDRVLQNINSFHWIAFTSRMGIDAFFQRLEQLNLPRSMLETCQICAIGKDAERLSKWGIKADLVPVDPSPKGIVLELVQVSKIEQQTVFVPVPKVIGLPEPDIIPNFISGLQNIGLTVTRVPVYKTQCLDRELYARELAMIRAGQVDAIAFSSTAEIESFLQMVNGKSDYEHCPIACFGPYTAANAKKLGLEVTIVAKDYSSFTGFVDAIADFFTPSW